MPAGTNTSHRRDNRWSARTPNHADTPPTTTAIVPTAHACADRSNGPATKPATVAAHVSSTGPSNSAPGTRSVMRRSGPYDEPSTKASATAGTNSTVAAMAAVQVMATTPATS